MSSPYKSIETLYKRSKETNKLDFDQIRQPEWKYINDWWLTEKIDGTNIRVTVTPEGLTVKGRSDAANIPSGLEKVIRDTFPAPEKIIEYFGGFADDGVTFYGEGYGPGITGSDKMAYRNPDQGKFYRCFDIKFGEHNWFATSEWQIACHELKIPSAPVMGFITELPRGEDDAREMMEQYARLSKVSEEEAGVGIQAEGLVARPPEPLSNRYGERIMWKMTNRELR